MGKKACLALDLGYDPWTDDYHSGDDELLCDYDDDVVIASHDHSSAVSGDAIAIDGDINNDNESDNIGAGNNNKCASEKFISNSTKEKNDCGATCKSVLKSSSTTASSSSNTTTIHHLKKMNPSSKVKKNASSSHYSTKLSVITPPKKNKSGQQLLHYVANPQRRPFFTEYIVNAHEGLLFQVASFLHMDDVLRLSVVSKLLQESLSVDGLYCNNSSDTNSSDSLREGKTGESCCYCDGDSKNGILLPCLQSIKHRLLPLPLPPPPPSSQSHHCHRRRRPHGLSQTFAHECLAFSQSNEQLCNKKSPPAAVVASNPNNAPYSNAIEPNTILNVKTSDEIVAISFRRIIWEQRSGKKGPSLSSSSSRQRKRSSVRLSYVQNDVNNCALITIWNHPHEPPNRQHPHLQYRTLAQSSPLAAASAARATALQQQHSMKERYLPPNTKTILDASIHSTKGLCAILATPLEYSNKERYVLSMVALPTAPPGTTTFHARGKTPLYQQQQHQHQHKQHQCNPRATAKPEEHTFLWQKKLPCTNWQFFSSSEAYYPIVAFNSPGTRLVFGSTERCGVLDVSTGHQLWSGSGNVPPPSSLSSQSTMAIPATTTPAAAILARNYHHPKQRQQSTIINAYLLHHEFLFLLLNNGTLLRIYDVSDTTSKKPRAEVNVPWTSVPTVREKQSYGLLRPHHGHEQYCQFSMRKEYEMVFCAGRIWITGTYHAELLCSSPPRLLRRLRSRLLPNVGGEDDDDGSGRISMQFARVKTDLRVGAPHPMYTCSWNNDVLYIVDFDKLYCWDNSKNTDNAPSQDGGSTSSGGVGVGRIRTIVSTRRYIEHVHIDRTKIIIGTNGTFRNTTVRGWDASGSLYVIPIDGSSSSAPLATEEDSAPSIPSSTTPGWQGPRPKTPDVALHPQQQHPYSPILQIYHRRFFQNIFYFVGHEDARDVTPRYPISNGSNANYQLVGSGSGSSSGAEYVGSLDSDGRYLLVQCKKGLARKVVMFDLYRHPAEG
eukprot:CAMPEP_0183709928 /NCGR_PEP_ID=MMETSP0737-20130205/5858_1 /TAXON_ID=385413 /ORGANISM="Thalassiosira miniscula, Strain CCMP1093" /LENGTH=1001 /DNA_ID=CAMNT_0025938147 /DNA_START=35 /DNA_END=3040 /DNA_ORIENTATION=-